MKYQVWEYNNVRDKRTLVCECESLEYAQDIRYCLSRDVPDYSGITFNIARIPDENSPYEIPAL